MNKKGCFIISAILLLIFALCFCSFGLFMLIASTVGTTDGGYQETVIESGDVDQKIAVIGLDGIIISGVDSTFATESEDMVENVIQKLKRVQEDGSFKAVIFTINTPGGSVYDSDRIAK